VKFIASVMYRLELDFALLAFALESLASTPCSALSSDVGQLVLEPSSLVPVGRRLVDLVLVGRRLVNLVLVGRDRAVRLDAGDCFADGRVADEAEASLAEAVKLADDGPLAAEVLFEVWVL